MKEQTLEQGLNSILQKSVSSFRKILINEQTFKDLQRLLVDFETVEDLLRIVVNLTTFIDGAVDQEMKSIRRLYELKYKELEGQLQKQEQLYRNLVKRQFLLRENIEHLQEQAEVQRTQMSLLTLSNHDLMRINEQLALEKQQLISRRNLQMCEKDLVINKLEQSLGIVQQSEQNKPEKTKIKQHHRRKSDEPIRSYIKDKKHILVANKAKK